MTQTLSDLVGPEGQQTNPSGASPEEAPAAIQGRTPLQLGWARLRRDRVAMGALATIFALVIIAIAAPVLVKLQGHGPNAQYHDVHAGAIDASGVPRGPNSHFWLGGDDVGRDVLSRLEYGARISLLVGIVATGLSMLIGIVVGLVAGFYGKWIDTLLSRMMDVFLSFPVILFSIALTGIYGHSLKLVIIVITLFGWPSIGRVVRGQVLSLREREFVEAARSLGAGDLRIMFIDILPNLIAPIIIYATLLIPVNIVYEATLSFLGLGIGEPTADWGAMLTSASSYYTAAPFFLIFTVGALLITTLAFNLFGDGLRDALDPRASRTLAK